MIDESLQVTRDEFMQNLGRLRLYMDSYTDQQLFEGEDELDSLKGFFRHRCLQIGRERGPSVLLYDNDGEGIRESTELNDALSKSKWFYEDQGRENPYRALDAWVVPADVHY